MPPLQSETLSLSKAPRNVEEHLTLFGTCVAKESFQLGKIYCWIEHLAKFTSKAPSNVDWWAFGIILTLGMCWVICKNNSHLWKPLLEGDYEAFQNLAIFRAYISMPLSKLIPSWLTEYDMMEFNWNWQQEDGGCCRSDLSTSDCLVLVHSGRSSKFYGWSEEVVARLTHSQSSELLHCIAQDELGGGMTLPGPGILECRYDTHCDVRIGNGSVMYL